MDTYRDEGYDAYFEGYGEADCPYDEGSYAFAEWMRGWNEADRLPLVDDRMMG